MDGPPSGTGAGAAPPGDDRVVTWIVSPHLLVAQAVAAALTSAGAAVAVRPWETVARDAWEGRDAGTTRYVVAIFDGEDSLTVVEEISRLVAVGDVRVAVVAPGQTAIWWGGLLEGGAVDVVTGANSISQLMEVVERLTTGDLLMDPAKRLALRAAWVQALDSRRVLIALMRTLSPQQMRVLELLASGRRVVEVAALMDVSVGTVRSHVKALRAKLGARTQLEAVAMLRQVYDAGGTADLVPRPREAPLAPQGRPRVTAPHR
ncbi:hypothetical protein GCM10009641_43570 [Mycobacterium cookii]|uniref:HTH luxR-type domain-containing protein n=1 Tax=Nocardioides furvisabuli TaxID=375542 RepID=A0ABP5JM99_9ACTN|nr:LuxR C-terminal-related transcriptional regulator [Nocardioides furvisabuli]